MKGFFNKLLRIDLTAKNFSYESLEDAELAKYPGGKGLGIYLLMRENKAGVAPLSSENSFIIATGPLTGTNMWGRSRFGVYTKSPATGGFGESYCGGSLAPKIKGCGVDAIIITGKADSLSSLIIDHVGVAFKEANHLAGAETDVTERILLSGQPSKAGAMVIGPAGEKQVVQACIKSDQWRSLGRGGMGAVLGSKRIKGIVFIGSKECAIADPPLLSKVTKSIAQKGKESPVTNLYKKLGTPLQVKVTNEQNCFPTGYWHSGHFDKWKNISADYMQNHFSMTPQACPPCFLKCTKRSVVKKGKHAGLEIEGPEYETIYALGGLNKVDSLEEIAWLNDVCDKLGIDTMSAGNLSAFAIEAYKAGKSDYAIDYNQPKKMAQLFKLIAKKEGIGAILAMGIAEASKKLNLEEMAIHVKGLEPAGFEPRVLKGMGLSYATAARGACHLRGTFYKAELSGQIDKETITDKAKFLIDYEDRATLFDCLILCRFFRDFILWDELLLLFEVTTGLDLSQEKLQNIANSITNQTRAFNLREGLDSSFDTLPKRFFKKNQEGARLTEDELSQMIKEYNQLRKE